MIKMHRMFIKSFDGLEPIDQNCMDALWLYMCYGTEPGSFVKSVLENDFMNALIHAHPALPLTALKGMTQWLQFMAPPSCYGSELQVARWQNKTDEERRDIMIKYKLRPSVVQILKGEEVA